MSDQMTEQPTESARDRRKREREEAEQAALTSEQASEQNDDEKPLSDEEMKEAVKIARVEGFNLTQSGEFRAATAPIRNRSAAQKAMDKVAEQAYADWTAAERPTTWTRLPVITYFLDPEEVADWRKMIRRACDVVVPESYQKNGETIEPSGVRARFGKEFVLTEKMAGKIGKPEEAGKTVLAWAAVDKRNVSARNGS